MTKTVKTSELTNLVLSNANEPTALKVSAIKEKYPKYCAGVEALRLAASRYACGVIDNTITAEQREGQVNAFFALYKVRYILRLFKMSRLILWHNYTISYTKSSFVV